MVIVRIALATSDAVVASSEVVSDLSEAIIKVVHEVSDCRVPSILQHTKLSPSTIPR